MKLRTLAAGLRGKVRNIEGDTGVLSPRALQKGLRFLHYIRHIRLLLRDSILRSGDEFRDGVPFCLPPRFGFVRECV